MTEKVVVTPYKITQTCGTKEELPHISMEEWINIQDNVDPNHIEQVRVPVEFPGPDGQGAVMAGNEEPTVIDLESMVRAIYNTQ